MLARSFDLIARYPPPPGWSVDQSKDGSGTTSYHSMDEFKGYHYEISHPLNSGDPDDFTLSPGDTVGFTINVIDDEAEHCWPTSKYDHANFVDLTLATPGEFDFLMFAYPPSVTIHQGEAAHFTVQVNLASGVPQTVVLTAGAIAGTMSEFNPSSGAPPFTSTLTITTSSGTPPGTYDIDVSGSGGGETHATPVTLIVEPASTPSTPFDFSLLVYPGEAEVTPGGSTTASVRVYLESGEAQEVSLMLSGQPLDISYSFTLDSGLPAFGSTLDITAGEEAPPGTYQLTVIGSGGGETHTAELKLVISGPAPTTFDFGLRACPGSRSIIQGGSANFNITVSLTSGTPQEVAVSISEVPEGADFNLSQPTGFPDFNSILTITTTQDTPAGTYNITVTATTDGNPTHTTIMQLEVGEAVAATVPLTTILEAVIAILVVALIIVTFSRKRRPVASKARGLGEKPGDSIS